MSDGGAQAAKPQRVAIIAGGGALPVEVARSAHATGNAVLAINLAGEADLQPLGQEVATEKVEWGQVGRLFSLLDAFGTDKLVIIGSVSKRPELRNVRLDWGGVQLLPRLLSTLMAGGDSSVLDKVADLFADKGYTLVGAHEVAPGVTAAAGLIAGPRPSDDLQIDLTQAGHAAWTAGHLDLGQGAVSVASRLVAMEGAEGTDGMLERVATMRQAGRFSSKGRLGALAKCPRPLQDLRMDLPAIGPRTIENAAKAGLSAILVEADHVLISTRDETVELCKRHSVSLIAQDRAAFVPPARQDVPS